ncbi:MAG: prolyl-tRNA synthetase associated domain-containing protein [Lachnospiraceae bacterium]|nr:prolyl-tRNA synthetase associated domain-containing protein [Lachnospiraceae bacterium]
MLQLENGRPKDLTGRLEREIKTYDFLDKLNIIYKRVDHEETNTMEACREVDELLQATICKNLFLCNTQKTNFYLLMMPGEKKFVTKNLSAQIGSARLSFAGPEHMEEFLDIKPGAVSVMGLMNDKNKRVRLLIDEDVLNGEYIGCHPCVSTSSLKIRTEDMIRKIIPAMEHEATIVNL